MSKPVPSEATYKAFKLTHEATREMMEFAMHGNAPELVRKRVVSEGFFKLHDSMAERLRVQIIDEPWREDYRCMADDVKAVALDLARQADHDAAMAEEPTSKAKH